MFHKLSSAAMSLLMPTTPTATKTLTLTILSNFCCWVCGGFSVNASNDHEVGSVLEVATSPLAEGGSRLRGFEPSLFNPVPSLLAPIALPFRECTSPALYRAYFTALKPDFNADCLHGQGMIRDRLVFARAVPPAVAMGQWCGILRDLD